ncbi:MAG TPA: hypothetical protein VLJ42_13185 [Solirubrobacteraceae bacterium]|nr:hypothetical protein [Solirubrobacteraceae bacterium]
MTEQSSPEQPAPAGSPQANSARLRVATGPLTGPVLCRVVSMVLARANCPVDRLDEAMLICDAISAHAPQHANDGHLAFTLLTDAHGVQLRVGELTKQGARQLVKDAVVPGVGNVLERLTNELRYEQSQDGAREELVLGISFD